MAKRREHESGFTLIEALVAMMIVAMVVISFIGIRTTALIDATHARNWRLAREIAEQQMSILQAGAHEIPPESGTLVPIEKYEGFAYKIVLGESAVSEAEGEIASNAAGNDSTANDRVEWQRNRDDYRRASSRGQNAYEYQESRFEDINQRLAEKAPSATDFEEVAVVVYFPKLDADYPDEKETLVIKARVSTLAISGKTPEKAAAMAQALNQASSGGTSGGAAGGASGGRAAGGMPGGR